MQISSIDQSYLTSLYTSLLSGSLSTSASSSVSAAQTDSVTLSSDVKQLPPPPHTMDFESMTDEEIKNYIQQMYNVTGTLPGGMEGSVEDLSEDMLSQIRSILTDMSESGSQAPSSKSSEAAMSSMSGEDIKSLLSMLILSMQSSPTSSNDSSDSSLFPSLTDDYLMQAMMSLSSKDEDSSSLAQQALTAYQQNILSI